MTSATYSLPARKARICRIAGAIFLVLATCSALEAVVLSLWPAPAFSCHDGCRANTRPVEMLDDDEKAKVVATPGAEQKLDAYVGRPIVRAGIFGVTLIDSVPFATLLLGVGIALRRLGGRGENPVAQALPWLRRASLAAIVWALAQPVSNSLMASLLSIGTPSGPHWYITINLVPIGTGLMLAIAAYATIWALESGLQAQRDLDAFV
ncbi:hypothetical protein ACFSC3_15600 [Sphingomonas floccifaciens]|uniref:DUF2975 domain-containing protein n=1 Tax=Sphingomonas floccifaciens TaxID=1844115 RepID=A0ABW4NK60_9SPHN